MKSDLRAPTRNPLDRKGRPPSDLVVILDPPGMTSGSPGDELWDLRVAWGRLCAPFRIPVEGKSVPIAYQNRDFFSGNPSHGKRVDF